MKILEWRFWDVLVVWWARTKIGTSIDITTKSAYSRNRCILHAKKDTAMQRGANTNMKYRRGVLKARHLANYHRYLEREIKDTACKPKVLSTMRVPEQCQEEKDWTTSLLRV